jgi:hypothetical protein
VSKRQNDLSHPNLLSCIEPDELSTGARFDTVVVTAGLPPRPPVLDTIAIQIIQGSERSGEAEIVFKCSREPPSVSVIFAWSVTFI